MTYELHWKCIPMGAIVPYENWYDPFLGQGVYMPVVATNDGKYVGYYVGESDDIGRRWRETLQKWFLNPDEEDWIAISAEEFLADPVNVFNEERMGQGLDNRIEIQKQILDKTWFCFAEVNDLRPWHSRENIEYVLQLGLKMHVGIEQDGYIGDNGRGRPRGKLTVVNHMGRPFFADTLPAIISFDDGDRVEVS